MTTPPKPMLACEADLPKIKYPVYVQPKLDGVRALIKGGVVWSRTGKEIPNIYVQARFRSFGNLDGELIVGDPTAKDVWNATSSGVMKTAGTPDVKFHVFDYHTNPNTFKERLVSLDVADLATRFADRFVVVPTTLIKTEEELLVAEDHYTSKGYEGLIIRAPDGLYKEGRSTQKEGVLLKLKRFHDAEGTVVGYGERMHNGNPATKDVFGRTKRSSSKALKTGRGDLGYLLLMDPKTGVQFEVGTGFDDAKRAELWANQGGLAGKAVTYKYQKLSPAGVPIFPVFKGFRSTLDF